jgi:hypothetical protein
VRAERRQEYPLAHKTIGLWFRHLSILLLPNTNNSIRTNVPETTVLLLAFAHHKKIRASTYNREIVDKQKESSSEAEGEPRRGPHASLLHDSWWDSS